jgi:hypothetical protein
MKMTEASRNNKHAEDVVTRSMSETLCEGEPLLLSSTACRKLRSLAMTVARAGGADLLRTKRSRTGRGPRRRRNGGYVVTAMTMNDYYTYNDETTHITA